MKIVVRLVRPFLFALMVLAGFLSVARAQNVSIPDAGLNAAITGGQVQLRTADAAKQWCCTAGGGNPLSSKYLPGACR